MNKIPILFELMKSNNIKQQQLSEAVGVSQGNISDWKNGRSSPSVEVLPKIAKYFNVSTDYLLGLDNVPNRKEKSPAAELTEAEQKLIDNFRQLSELEKGEIIGRTAAFAEQHVQSEPSRKGA